MSDANPQQSKVAQTVTGDRNIIAGTGDVNIRGDVIHGDQTIIQQIVQQAVEKLTGSPYKFLSSYGLADRDIFYGRDTVIEEIAGRVPQHKVVIVNGASGSGKTSLVNAGILPRLAEHGYTFIDFREYSDPLAQVRDYLTGHGLIHVEEEATLQQILAAFRAKQETKLVVVFDQFERFLVNVPPKTRRAFIAELQACMAAFSGEEMNVVIVLRQDWLGQMYAEIEDVIPEFGAEAYRYNLKALGRSEAREAIIRPLEQVEAKIGYDEAFVDEVLLGSLEQEGEQDTISPPHLQIVCHQLFEAAHTRYEKKGGVVVIDEAMYNELGGVEKILNSYLDRTVEEIAGDPEKVAVVRSMLKAMVETTGTRKFVSLEDLGGALPDVNEAEVAKLLERLSVRRVVEERDAKNSLSHEYMVGQVQSWFDVRELERRKARETLDRGLAAYQTSQSLLDERQVAHIRQWLGALSEDEEALLAKSRRRYVLERWVKIGAVVVLIAVAALSVVLALVMRQSLIVANAASIVNSFNAEEELGEGEHDALWALAAADEDVRTQVLQMFLKTEANADRFRAHSGYLLHALLGIDPEHRAGPLEEAISQNCTVPDLDQKGIMDTCLALARQLEQVPQGFSESIVVSIENEQDASELSYLAVAFASLGERVDAGDAVRVGNRLLTSIENEQDAYWLTDLAYVLASLGGRLDTDAARALGSRLLTSIENEQDPERLSPLIKAYASLGERVDAGSRLVEAIEKEQDAYELSTLAQAFASLGEGVDAGDVVRVGNKLLTSIENEPDAIRLSYLAQAYALLGEGVGAGDAVRVGNRLVAAIESEAASGILSSSGLSYLAAALVSLGGRLDAGAARALGSRLVTVIENEPDAYRLSRLVEAYASLGEGVDAGDAVRVGNRLLASIEIEVSSGILSSRLSYLAQAYASLGEWLDANDVASVASTLMAVFESLENPDIRHTLAQAFASLGEWLAVDAARALASRLLTSIETEENFVRRSSLVEAFAPLGKQLENDRLLQILRQPTCHVELQRVLIESLATKAGEEDLEAVGLTVTGQEWNDFVLDRWTFARWAKGQGFDISMMTDPSKARPPATASAQPGPEAEP